MIYGYNSKAHPRSGLRALSIQQNNRTASVISRKIGVFNGFKPDNWKPLFGCGWYGKQVRPQMHTAQGVGSKMMRSLNTPSLTQSARTGTFEASGKASAFFAWATVMFLYRSNTWIWSVTSCL